MPKIYFYLLILCGVMSQGIIGTVGDEMEESSDILLRQKRVVSYVRGEDIDTRILEKPYVVTIRYKKRTYCTGNILSHHVVITIAQCVTFDRWLYAIFSGTSRSTRGNNHEIIEIKKNFGGHPSRPADGIALLKVDPPFVFRTYTDKIELHSEPLLQGTLGVVSGWGYNLRCPQPGTRIPTHLRSIEVPIMAHRDCVNIYRPHFAISDKDVCTYHPQRHCGDTDGGAPLVVDGKLAGIRLWTIPVRDEDNPHYPDVFVLLQHSDYNQWIRTNIDEI